jgi:hypothetical protein
VLEFPDKSPENARRSRLRTLGARACTRRKTAAARPAAAPAWHERCFASAMMETDSETTLGGALKALLEERDRSPWVREALVAIRVRHRTYGAGDKMCGWLADALLAKFTDVPDVARAPHLCAAWRNALAAVASITVPEADVQRFERVAAR